MGQRNGRQRKREPGKVRKRSCLPISREESAAIVADQRRFGDGLAGGMKDDPDRFRLLVERGMKRLASELGRATEREAGLRWSRRLMSIARHHPVVRPFFRDEECHGLALRRAISAASSDPLELIERHEGPEAADVARRWLDRQPDDVWIVADESPVPAGFVQLLLLSERDRDSTTWDPVVRCCYRISRVRIRICWWRQGKKARST